MLKSHDEIVEGTKKYKNHQGVIMLSEWHIKKTLEQRDAEVREMVENRLTEFIDNIPEAYGWGKEDEEADKGYQICSKNVKAMLNKEKDTILLQLNNNK